jgi:hypothetical protein
MASEASSKTETNLSSSPAKDIQLDDILIDNDSDLQVILFIPDGNARIESPFLA